MFLYENSLYYSNDVAEEMEDFWGTVLLTAGVDCISSNKEVGDIKREAIHQHLYTHTYIARTQHRGVCRYSFPRSQVKTGPFSVHLSPQNTYAEKVWFNAAFFNTVCRIPAWTPEQD